MDIISFTYKLIPQKEGGYSVVCLDWSGVISQGETINQCKQNAAEATELMLEVLLSGKIDKKSYPKVHKYPASPFHFQLTFDVKKAKNIQINRFSNNTLYREIKKIASIF